MEGGKKYIIALDQGTTSSRCILFDRAGRMVSMAQKELTQYYPQPGWVEHDAVEIWASMTGVVTEAMQRAGAKPEEAAGIGITNQRETTVVWDADTGAPVSRAICWQCRRTAPIIEKLRADGLWDYVKEHTGLIPDAYFSASKVAWILENVPGAREKAEAGKLRFGTVDSWLIWNLTGGKVHAADHTNASRTMLYDIRKLSWDEELLRYFRIPASMLPSVQPSGSYFGETKCFGGSIPVCGAAGDQQAALFGQCGFVPGSVKNTYGTGGFMLMNTGADAVRTRTGLLTTIAATTDGNVQYAVEGSVFVAGAAIQWLRDEMQLIRTAPETEAVCRSVPDTNGVYLVPAFTGLGAPWWNPEARGTVVGLTRGVRKEHFIRAAVESLVYQTDDLLRTMREESGLAIKTLRVDGGAAANDFLMEFQADVSDVAIERPACIETTALGAAYLAGLTAGFWKNREELSERWSLERRFTPRMEPARREELQKGWKRAVRAALSWTDT